MIAAYIGSHRAPYCPPLVHVCTLLLRKEFLPVLKMVEPYIHVYGAGHRVALSSSTRSDRVCSIVPVPQHQILLIYRL